jgi:hypothetical protein
MLVIPALRRLRQRSHKFKANLCCIMRRFLGKKIKSLEVGSSKAQCHHRVS